MRPKYKLTDLSIKQAVNKAKSSTKTCLKGTTIGIKEVGEWEIDSFNTITYDKDGAIINKCSSGNLNCNIGRIWCKD